MDQLSMNTCLQDLSGANVTAISQKMQENTNMQREKGQKMRRLVPESMWSENNTNRSFSCRNARTVIQLKL